MKKVIISMLLIVLVIGSVFAIRNDRGNFPVSVSAKFAISENGIKAQSAGIYAQINKESLEFLDDLYSPYKIKGNPFDVKIGYVFSFDKDPAVSGVYADVLLSTIILKGNTDGKLKPLFVKPGISADFHMVNGQLKANVAAAAEINLPLMQMPVPKDDLFLEIGAKIMPRYIFWNNTGADAFTLEVSSEVFLQSDK